MLYFRADYDEREAILNAGAKWEFRKFAWVVEERADYKKFSKWVKAKTFTDAPMFIEAGMDCPYCGKPVKAVAIACGEYFEDGEVYGAGCVNIMSGIEHAGAEIGAWLRSNYSVRKRYFPAYGYKYLSNGCEKCGGILSDDYLFDREESPFYADCEDKAGKLIIKKVRLGYDIPLGGFVKWSFPAERFAGCITGAADLKIF